MTTTVTILAVWAIAVLLLLLIFVANGKERAEHELALTREHLEDVLREQHQPFAPPYEPPTVRPFYGSPRHLRALDALADSEAARFDPDTENWSKS